MNYFKISMPIFLFISIFIWLLDPLESTGMETTTSGPEHETEYWQGKVLTATFRAGMCFAPDGNAKGVLILRHSNGNEDVYHLYGTMKNNQFDLSHSSGHFFSGQLIEPDKLKGKVKLNKGITLSMEGKRTKNVRLDAEDCAPLNR